MLSSSLTPDVVPPSPALENVVASKSPFLTAKPLQFPPFTSCLVLVNQQTPQPGLSW